MDTEISSGVPLGAYTLPGRVSDPRVAIGQAVEAERLGLSTLWLSERWGTKDLGVLAGALGQVTSRVRIASGITHFQSRHPALLASLAMTAQAVTDGRFILGIGRSVDAMWDAVGLPGPRTPRSSTMPISSAGSAAARRFAMTARPASIRRCGSPIFPSNRCHLWCSPRSGRKGWRWPADISMVCCCTRS